MIPFHLSTPHINQQPTPQILAVLSCIVVGYKKVKILHNMFMCNSLIVHPRFGLLKTVYNDNFPIEVRFVCASWIETRIQTELSVDINDPQIEEMAANFLHELIQQVKCEKELLVRADQLSIRCRLDAAIETFTRHSLCPFAVYKQIRDTIAYEADILGLGSGNFSCVDEETIDITRRLNALKSAVLENTKRQTIYKSEIQSYNVLDHQETLTQTIEMNDNFLQERQTVVLEDCQQRKYRLVEMIKARFVDLHQNIANTIFEIEVVQRRVINRLNKWRSDQALAGNGAYLNHKLLDEMQMWFEKLAEIIWTTRYCIEATRDINRNFSFKPPDYITEEAFQDVTTLLKNLIESAFIVEHQPPQVLKTDVNFSATVRLLTGNLGIQMNNPSIVVSFLSTTLQSKHKPENCEILNNIGKFDIQPSTNHLSCTFNNMKLKKFKRKGDKKEEHRFVTERKYALAFHSTFRTSDIEINVLVKTLPLVVAVHTYQEPHAWATIVWDNAFSHIDRERFHVVDTVTWTQLVNALNMKFTAETNKGLSVDCSKYLYEKVFGSDAYVDDRPITWNQFSRTPLPSRSFSLWEWFYSVMKFVKNRVQVAWTNNFIIGFIDKQQTIEKLQHCPNGTFLLRFSESHLGGLSIAYFDEASYKVVMLEPFSSEDIGRRSLDDRVLDLHQCVSLYPNIPKDLAFEKHSIPVEKPTVSTTGYVKTILMTTIQNPDNGSLNCSCRQMIYNY